MHHSVHPTIVALWDLRTRDTGCIRTSSVVEVLWLIVAHAWFVGRVICCCGAIGSQPTYQKIQADPATARSSNILGAGCRLKEEDGQFLDTSTPVSVSHNTHSDFVERPHSYSIPKAAIRDGYFRIISSTAARSAGRVISVGPMMLCTPAGAPRNGSKLKLYTSLPPRLPATRRA